MSDGKAWRLFITPLGDESVDDAALEGLVFVDEHESLDSAREEGLRVLRGLRASDEGNDWYAVCYGRTVIPGRGVQLGPVVSFKADD